MEDFDSTTRRIWETKREQWAEKEERLREQAEKEIDAINLQVRLAVFAAAALIYSSPGAVESEPDRAVDTAWEIWREVRRGEERGAE